MDLSPLEDHQVAREIRPEGQALAREGELRAGE